MHDERWLVKSSGKILGPFTLEELIQHVRARTLSIIDEIREPGGRWAFIRENILLREVVQQLRNEDDLTVDATQTTFVGRTVTHSVTDAQDESTPTPSTPQSRPGEPRPIQGTDRTVNPLLGSVKSYGSPQDRRVQEAIERKSNHLRNLIWTGALLLVAAAGGFFYNQQRLKTQAQEQARQWVRIAHEQIRYGQNARALDYLNQADASLTLTAEERLLRAQLLLQIEGKSAEALELVGPIAQQADARLTRDVALTRALAFLRERRWQEAGEELNNVLAINPRDEQAQLNMIVLDYFRGHTATAWNALTRLQERGEQSSLFLVLRGMMALNWPEKAGQALRVQQASDELRTDLQNSFELRFEKQLVLLNLRQMAGKQDEVLKLLGSMWDADPFDSRNFAQSLQVDQQILGWERLFPLCEKIFKSIPEPEGSRALRVSCLHLRGESSQALQKIEESRRQLSASPLLASLHADLLFEVGRSAEARTLLTLTGDESLGEIVRGKVCQNDKDWVCAENAWKSVLAKEEKNPMAVYGYGFVSKQRGNESLARDVFRNGILASPRYRPLLEARGESNVF